MKLVKNYKRSLIQIKSLIYKAQYQALKSVNKELLELYWSIGKIIFKKQKAEKWGKSTVENLAKDLQVEFPGIRGFSARNIWDMRAFYETYKENKKLRTLSAEIPWSHNLFIFQQCKDELEREFYLKLTIKFKLSFRTLKKRIKQDDYQRFLVSQNNFNYQLEEKQAEKALMLTKDDYNLDFLLLKDEHTERELEDALVKNVVNFLDELGGLFAFVGRQYRIEFKGKEFFVDLLFYHRRLRCLVAIELKVGEFKPEYAGKMQFYLSALDDIERVEDENPSIGIIICGDKDKMMVEYTLRETNRPIGVATYNHYSSLAKMPKNIAKYLPSKNDIKKRLRVMIK